jgi:lipid-A-disaccharide synthase
MNRKVVSEILQNDFTVERIEKELKSITESEKREKQLKDYESLNQKLSAGGASVKTAKSIVNLLQNKI